MGKYAWVGKKFRYDLIRTKRVDKPKNEALLTVVGPGAIAVA